MISKAQVMALAAGDGWLDQGANLLVFGPPGVGKSHICAALGLALVENGYRVLFTRTTDLVQKLQIARRELALEAALNKLDKYHLPDPRRHHLRHQGSSRNLRAVRAHQRPLRATIHSDHRQPGLRRMGQDLSRPGHDAGRHRSAGAPRHHLRDECRELPTENRARQEKGPRPTAQARHR